MIETGEPLMYQAIDAHAATPCSEAAGSSPAEVERLRLQRKSLFQAAADCRFGI